jgi:decaprenyl-phosphate phosphoribosyltransferase
VLAGAFALDIPASPWLLACTGLLAMFLGFGKRAHELAAARRRRSSARRWRATTPRRCA